MNDVSKEIPQNQSRKKRKGSSRAEEQSDVIDRAVKEANEWINAPQKIFPHFDDEYEIETILDSRKRRGVREYLIKWQHYDTSFNSWESQLNISPDASNCLYIIYTLMLCIQSLNINSWRRKRVSVCFKLSCAHCNTESQPLKKKSKSSTPVPTNTTTTSLKTSLQSRHVKSSKDRRRRLHTAAMESVDDVSEGDKCDVSEGVYERELHAEHCEQFWRFVHERQEIWRKKSASEPAPWTSDPILRCNSFTNVYRELDRGTLYLQQHLKHVNSNNNNNSPSQVRNTHITCQHTHQTCHRCCGSV